MSRPRLAPRPIDNATGRRRIFLIPSRADQIDAGFVLILIGLALVGFQTTYSGSLYLITGLAGAVLGVVIAHLGNALRQPMITVAVMAVAAFFLAGGAIALHATAIAGVIPSGSTFHGLADQSVHGWKDLLTTLPPVDGSGPLVVLPYLMGLVGGATGFLLARRTVAAAAPVLAPAGVLVLVILLGTQTPAAQVLQGAVFGVVTLGWIAVRAGRRRAPISSGSGQVARWATIAVLLGIACGGAAILGPLAPGAGSHPRTVLRTYVQPPFDIGRYPSPLAGFRRYTKPAKALYTRELFTVTGLASGTWMRIATMDDYNALTWTASNTAPLAGAVLDTFQRVGTQISVPIRGTSHSFTVRLGPGYDDVWLPDVGALTEIHFSGPRASEHAQFFRYNLATGTGVVPDHLKPGDSIQARAVLPANPVLRPADIVRADTTLTDASAFLKTQAGEWSGTSASPTARILALGKHLYDVGKYSSGEPPNQQYLPGHSESRLRTFAGGAQIVGDDEQYAAAYALMINQIGTPARVVLGAQVGPDGKVTGANVHAWVEVQVNDGTWRAIRTNTFMNRANPPDRTPPQPQQRQGGKIVPPPARIRPRSSLADAAEANSRSRNDPTRKKKHAAAATPAGPLLPAWVVSALTWSGPPAGLLLLLIGAIVAAKALRRHRRRTRGSPAIRLARGWTEIVDHARDLGTATTAARTRREQAAELSQHPVAELARRADAQVFGPQEPQEADAHAFWAEVDATRRRMSANVGWRRRLRAAVNFASFRAAGEAQ